MKYLLPIILLPLGLLLGGCSDNEPVEQAATPKQELSGKHVWKTQVDAVKKAKGVEQMILQGSEQQKAEIEAQAQ